MSSNAISPASHTEGITPQSLNDFGALNVKSLNRPNAYYSKRAGTQRARNIEHTEPADGTVIVTALETIAIVLTPQRNWRDIQAYRESCIEQRDLVRACRDAKGSWVRPR